MTLAEAEKAIIQQIGSLYDPSETKEIAFLVLEHLCGINKAQFLSEKSSELPPADETTLIHIIDELKKGKPVQYIIGETEFYGLRFNVNPSVLIPRPETEELVDWLLKEVRSLKSDLNILDIGTGSGCIAIVLKKHLSEVRVYAMDISAEALKTAVQNAELNNAEVEFITQDILKMSGSAHKYSVIVSNPPYITQSEKEQMHVNVLEYEPHTALFVSDNDPLIFYKHIAEFAAINLNQNGLLFFEINESHGEEIMDILQQKGFLDIQLKKDLNGRDRMIMAKYRGL